MKRWLIALGLLTGLLALAACAAKEKTTPAPATPTAGAKAPWEEEWERVLASAKREGTVAVAGSSGAEIRRGLTEPFQKKYGITVEFLGASASEMAPRIQTERAAGKYLWDVIVHGTGTPLLQLKPVGVLSPIEPALILPEAKDGKNWLGGRLDFADKDHTVLVFSTFSLGALMVNSKLADPKEFKSYKDLLDPKWKGKIVALNPTAGGAGRGTFSLFYQHKDLGPDFIRSLAKQELILTQDEPQAVEWVGAGKYSLCLGCSPHLAKPLVEQGVPIVNVDPRQVREGGYLSSGLGSVMLVNNAPHPNAAKVYINWLLGKEAQTEFARAAGYASRRLDVPADFLEAWQMPVESFWKNYDEAGTEIQAKAASFSKEVFGQ